MCLSQSCALNEHTHTRANTRRTHKHTSSKHKKYAVKTPIKTHTFNTILQSSTKQYYTINTTLTQTVQIKHTKRIDTNNKHTHINKHGTQLNTTQQQQTKTTQHT